MKPARRLHHLDAARSVLMALGIVFHAAQVYSTDTEWLIKDATTSAIFSWIVASIHAFRMPAFFFISGLFCALTVERRDVRGFLSHRLSRILVPLATVGLLLNAPQVLWLAYRQNDIGRVADSVAWLDGSLWLLHLWFLAYLAVYFVVAGVAGRRCLSLLRRAANAAARRRIGPTATTLLLLVGTSAIYLTIVPAQLFGILYADIPFLGTYFGLVLHFCFFALGFAVMADPRLYDAYVARGWLSIPAWLLASAATTAVRGPLAPLFGHLSILMAGLGAVYATLLVFRLAVRQPSRVWRYSADAAYTVYLLHHPIIVVTGALLVGSTVPIGLKFATLCLCALGTSLAFHHYVVLRVPAVSYLLNGQRRPTDPVRVIPDRPSMTNPGLVITTAPVRSEAARD
jgi:glucan biosynthesis protein C